MAMMDFTLRPMQFRDIDAGMRLSLAQGWNQTTSDWNFLINCPLNICLVAEHKDNVIGTVCVSNYSEQVAWIGMMLVDETYRGFGVSKRLLHACFKKLGLQISIKLDATPDGHAVYKKFNFSDEYGIQRLIKPAGNFTEAFDEHELIPYTIKYNSDLIDLDAQAFGTRRPLLMDYFTTKYPSYSWLLKRNNSIQGFLLGRAGSTYHHIGPVVAPSTHDAKILLARSLKVINTQPVVVDVLSDKISFIEWLSSIGFVHQRQFTRMYKNVNVSLCHIDHQYLIAGPEFG